MCPGAILVDEDRNAEAGTGRAEAIAGTTRRHYFWLRKRARPNEVTTEGWRPQKRYRVATKRWRKQVDTMLKYGTSFKGLVAFKRQPKQSQWSEAAWRSWPFLVLTPDQGSDGVAGINALLRKSELKLNVDAFWDPWHGVQNDIELGYKKEGLYPFVLLLMITHNLNHGPPKEEDLRYKQLCESRSYLYSKFTANTSVLFQTRARGIAAELDGLYEANPGQSREEALWEYLAGQAPFERKGHRAKLCEFFLG